jgi:hypothetical protein
VPWRDGGEHGWEEQKTLVRKRDRNPRWDEADTGQPPPVFSFYGVGTEAVVRLEVRRHLGIGPYWLRFPYVAANPRIEWEDA